MLQCYCNEWARLSDALNVTIYYVFIYVLINDRVSDIFNIFFCKGACFKCDKKAIACYRVKTVFKLGLGVPVRRCVAATFTFDATTVFQFPGLAHMDSVA